MAPTRPPTEVTMFEVAAPVYCEDATAAVLFAAPAPDEVAAAEPCPVAPRDPEAVERMMEPPEAVGTTAVEAAANAEDAEARMCE